MRKTLAALVFLFIAGNLFAGPCDDPYIMIQGIKGELPGLCDGGIDFMSARVAGNTLIVLKKLDKASPALYLACATGHHINSATITVRSQSGGPSNLTYEFKDLLISSVSQLANPVNETVSLTFKGFESHTPGATKGGSAAARPRELKIMGTARAGGATLVFLNGAGAAPQTATGWQTSIRSGSGPTASLQLQPKPASTAAMTQAAVMQAPATTAPSTLGCVELRSGGTLLVRYVFQGVVPAQGGNVRVDKMQIQIPPGPTCNWMAGQPGWNMGNNTAM